MSPSDEAHDAEVSGGARRRAAHVVGAATVSSCAAPTAAPATLLKPLEHEESLLRLQEHPYHCNRPNVDDWVSVFEEHAVARCGCDQGLRVLHTPFKQLWRKPVVVGDLETALEHYHVGASQPASSLGASCAANHEGDLVAHSMR